MTTPAASHNAAADAARQFRPASAIAVIAHRGAHEHAPENTLPAFQAAVDLGVDYVEMDLCVTADGELVVIHDSVVDRVTDGTGPAREKTLAEIKALDAGSWFDPSFAGTRLATADEALALLRGRTNAYIEAKDIPAEAAVALLARHDMFGSSVIYARADELAAMRAIDPRVRGFVPRPPKDLALLPALVERVRPSVFGSSDREITAEIVAACHAAGALVFVNNLHVDAPEGWARTISLGGDALETDHPAALLAYLRERGLHA